MLGGDRLVHGAGLWRGINDGCQQHMAGATILPGNDGDLRAALIAFAGRLLRLLLEDKALAIHRVVISESVRFPELGRAFYDNGPGLFLQGFGAWLAAQTAAGRMAVVDPAMAAEQFIGLLRGGLYLRASLGLNRPSEAEVDAAVTAAIDAFVRAYGVR